MVGNSNEISKVLADWASAELDGDVARLDDQTVVVIGRQNQSGGHQGNPLPVDAVRLTLVLLRQRGEWRLAGAHMSFIAGTLGAPPMPAG